MTGVRRGRKVSLALAAAAALAACLLLPGWAGAGGTTLVNVTDDQFTPPDDEDASFNFVWDANGDGQTANTHNVRQNDNFFRSGPLTDGPQSFFVDYKSAGAFPYYCENHGSPSGGMRGVIRFYVYPGSEVPGESVVMNWGRAGSGYRHDVQFRIDDGRWRNWYVDTRRIRGNFGKNNKPVNLNPAKEYEVRARTQKGQNERLRSGFSSPREVTGI